MLYIPFPFKRCSRCHEFKHLAAFNRLRKSPDGLKSHCKECRHKEYETLKISKSEAQVNPAEVFRVCRACGKPTRYEHLKKLKSGRDGVSAICYECHRAESRRRYAENLEHCRAINRRSAARRDALKKREYKRQWFRIDRARNPDKYRQKRRREYLSDPEKHKRRSRIWHKQNPEIVRNINKRRATRRLLLLATFTNADWDICLKYWHHQCAYCGRPRGLWHTLAQDHFIAQSKNGGYAPENIIPACHGESGCNNSKNDRDPTEWLTARFGARKAKTILKRIQDYFAWVKNL